MSEKGEGIRKEKNQGKKNKRKNPNGVFSRCNKIIVESYLAKFDSKGK